MTDHRQRARARGRHRALGGATPASRQLGRQQRRDELLEAALVAVRRHGQAASMEQIAAEAGITKPILYRYFGDKDGLLAAVADRFADALIARLDEALAAADDHQRLRAAINSYVGFIEDDLGLYTFLTQHAAVHSPVLLGVIDRVAATVARAIGESLRAQGADTGAAEPWAYGIVGMVHLAGARWVASPTISRDRLVDYLVRLVWEGMARRG